MISAALLRLFGAGAVSVVLLWGCASPETQPRTVRIATTTSIENSGLLAELRTAFKEASGVEIEAHVVGSGKAFDLAKSGQVEVAITHEPAGEAELLATGRVAAQSPFMANEFIVAGPSSDPVGVRGSSSVAEAMLRVHRAGAPFVSRGDRSGTHARELSLWARHGVNPDSNPAYRELGQGMSALLRSASELEAYTLTDETTFVALSRVVRLVELARGGEGSRNVYTVTLMRGSGEEAEAFHAWLVSPAAGRIIERFGKGFIPLEPREKSEGMSYDEPRKSAGEMGHSEVETGHQAGPGAEPNPEWQS